MLRFDGGSMRILITALFTALTAPMGFLLGVMATPGDLSTAIVFAVLGGYFALIAVDGLYLLIKPSRRRSARASRPSPTPPPSSRPHAERMQDFLSGIKTVDSGLSRQSKPCEGRLLASAAADGGKPPKPASVIRRTLFKIRAIIRRSRTRRETFFSPPRLLSVCAWRLRSR